MTALHRKKVLISGASFAGLASAYWMHRLGYEVTIVEIAPRLRTGGTAVNIGGNTIDIVKRMGIFEQIRAHRLQLRQFDFKNADDQTERSMRLGVEGEPAPEDDYEIERDVLMHLLLDAVSDDCDIIYGDSIVALHEAELVEVSFQYGRQAAYDLVLGCDGLHSGVRKLCFGAEAQHMHFLQQYFSISIVNKLLIERDTAQMFNVPGKMVMLNAYKNKTDIIFGFVCEQEIAYDYRDEAQQRRMINEQFRGVGWRATELLDEMEDASNFYFDKLCQIRMPSWSRGRVALVGDAAYCASPAAGKGGSLAIDGAAALADAMQAATGDYAHAFRLYDENFRPYINEVQADAVRVGLETLIPRTEEAIRVRNAKTETGF